MYNILCVVCSNGGIQTNKILKRFVAYFVVSAMFVCSVPVLAADEYADKIFNNEVGNWLSCSAAIYIMTPRAKMTMFCGKSTRVMFGIRSALSLIPKQTKPPSI